MSNTTARGSSDKSKSMFFVLRTSVRVAFAFLSPTRRLDEPYSLGIDSFMLSVIEKRYMILQLAH